MTDKLNAPDYDSILAVLNEVILDSDRRLLEIGSGKGEHAAHLAPHFPQVEWYPTDVTINLKAIAARANEAGSRNIQKPTRVEIGKDELPKLKFDFVFAANVFHFNHWKECKSLIKQFGGRLREGSRVAIYGPFKYNGNYTTPSHEELDKYLKEKDSLRGIRSFEDVNNAMIKNGFELLMDEALPDQNHMLVYRRLKFIPSR